MFIEANLRNVKLDGLSRLSAFAEEVGFDGVGHSEVTRDPFLALTIAACNTHRVRLTTSVAIAFPRSPMVVAYLARNLQELSRDRFVLGLGTQVRAHIQHRFSSEWGAPGPRLRDYLGALRAIWDTWQRGVPLAFQGTFYSFTLMTPEFSLGPTDDPPIKLQIGAVNAYNLQLAGEICDGVRLHSFVTPEYIRDVIWPNLRRGAARSGRSLDAFEVMAGGFIATGATDAEVEAEREKVRYRIGHYASTRAYLPVLEHHGWTDAFRQLRELIAAGRWKALASVITDEMLDRFCAAATYERLPGVIRERLGGLVDGIILPMSESLYAHRDRLASAVAELRRLAPADRGPRVTG